MDIFQVLATGIILVFYIAYLVKGRMLKKQGIDSNRFAKGDKSNNARRIELYLFVSTLLMPIAQILSVFINQTIFIYSSYIIRAFGLGLATLGLFFFFTAIIFMRNSWRAGIDRTQKTKLVKNGIYRYSRNPAFVGFDLFYLGIALCFPNLIIFLLTTICIILFHFQILEEEQHLKIAFGQDYTKYFSEVNRYIGKRR